MIKEKKLQKSKILVTGCAGFIASRVCELLLEGGESVFGIDNMNDYYDIRLKSWRLKQLKKHRNFEFKKIDIEDSGKLATIFVENKFSSVVNLAARAGVRYSMENPQVYMTTNAMGTLNILELMKEHKVKKFLLASTSSLYAGEKMPFLETLPVNSPISPYAASKKAAESLAYTYHYLYGIDVSILRFFTVYGPAGRPDMSIFRFIKWIDEESPIQLFGDGKQARDFTFVDDIAKGVILALKPLGFEVINLGGGKKPITINAMIELMAKLLEKRAKIKYLPANKSDMDATQADIRKAGRLLGWKPEISFEDGIAQTVNWYCENKKWLKDIKI